MFVSHGKILAGVLLAALSSPGMSLQSALRAGANPDSLAVASGAPLRHFSADLAIRHRRVTPAGVPVGLPRPDTLMHIVRELREGRWVTVLSTARPPESLVDIPGGPTRLSNPFLVTRVEFADDEARPRLFDRRGRQVRGLTAEDLRLVGAAAAVREAGRGLPAGSGAGGVFLAEAGALDERRRELARRFGAPVGRLRGLDRYVAASGDGRHEVLVTPATALPVEMFMSSTTAGQMRTGLTYEARGSYGHIRRLMRSEHHFADSGAGRAITEVELANVVLSSEVLP
ncbi:MAG: hypothetical protein IT183_14210 [Acidobacteria bacterium]|nr:hypothetical protein [Acidobacteriota bacterium]